MWEAHLTQQCEYPIITLMNYKRIPFWFFFFFKESGWVCWISVFLFIFLFILLYFISVVQFIIFSSFDVPIISHFLCPSLFNAINYLLVFLKNSLYFWKYYLGFPINFFQPFPLTPLPVFRSYVNIAMIGDYYELNCVPTLPALTSNAIVFGLRPFRDVIKFKWGHKSRSLIQKDWCHCK